MRMPAAGLVLLLAGSLSAQGPETGEKPSGATEKAAAPATPVQEQDAAELLSSLRGSMEKLVALGKAADRPLRLARGDQPVKMAVPLLHFVRRHVSTIPAPEQEPDEKEVEKRVQEFSKCLGEFIKLGGDGITAADTAFEGTDGFDKTFGKEVKKRLYTQVAYEEIQGFLKDGQNAGTFDGMFPKTQALGRPGAEAMRDLFLDIDQAANVRTLAGEGVAQMGSEEDIASVREVWNDNLEEQALREKAKLVMARLGDRSLFNKDLAQVDEAIAEQQKKLEPVVKHFNELLTEKKELDAVGEPTAEQKERAEALAKELNETHRQVVELFGSIGSLYQQRARLFLEVRDLEKAEEAYRNSLQNWLRIANVLQRNPNAKGQVSIAFYNLACVQAQQKKLEPAMKTIEECFKWGYTNWDWALQDGDLANLRKEGKLQALIEEVKSGKAMERWKKEADAAQEKAASGKPEKPEKPDGAPDGDTP